MIAKWRNMLEKLQVIDIKDIDKKRRKIIFDDKLYIALYIGDIRRLSISIGIIIDEKLDSSITELLYKRAKERCFYILKDSDKTRKQLEDKLKQSFYPVYIVDKVLSMLEEYGYVDDVRYAKNYIETRCRTKSIKQIKQELANKGIAFDIVKAVLEDEGEQEDRGQQEAIKKLLLKKRYDGSNRDYEYRSRYIRYLLSKGFEYGMITEVMETY